MNNVFYIGGGTFSNFVVTGYGYFSELRATIAEKLLDTQPFNAGTWQRLDVSQSDAHATYELLNAMIQIPIPESMEAAQRAIQPSLPWAEDHFQERVGGEPVNPGSTHHYWPFHGQGMDLHLRKTIYDHNYMERIWPKEAGWDCDQSVIPHFGIRFAYGDLDDVVDLLQREPHTRQAYLPIWFPEDTGVNANQRVPCTIGYHFIVRDGQLHVQYNMRSLEIYRHLTNDVYLAMRLAQWVARRIGVSPGVLTMHAVSLHGFVGDRHHIERMADNYAPLP